MNYHTMATTPAAADVHPTLPSSTTTPTGLAPAAASSPQPPSRPHFTITTRTLRAVPLWTFPPTFILLLAHGVASAEPFPALTLLPAAGSCLLTGALRAGVHHHPAVPAARRGAAVAFAAEALLAILYFALLVPSWVSMDEGQHSWRANPVLAAYGTVPVMGNFAIHLYLLALAAPHVLAAHFRRARAWYVEQVHAGACPHCEGNLGVGRRACRETGNSAGGAAAGKWFPLDQKAQPEYDYDVGDDAVEGYGDNERISLRSGDHAQEMLERAGTEATGEARADDVARLV